MQLRRLVIFIAAAFAVAACGDSDDEVFVTSQAGAIEVSPGEEFVVSLESNASTGYAWELSAPLAESVVELVSDTYIEGDTDIVGAPGRQELRFRALADGSTYIQLWYVRSFDDPAEPTERAQYELIVGTGRPADVRPGNGDPDDQPATAQPDDPSAVSLTELLDSGATGSVVVDALVYAEGSQMRLCEVFAESFPVQCMGRTVAIANPDAVDADFTQHEDIRWTDRVTQLSGQFDGTTLNVDAG